MKLLVKSNNAESNDEFDTLGGRPQPQDMSGRLKSLPSSTMSEETDASASDRLNIAALSPLG